MYGCYGYPVPYYGNNDNGFNWIWIIIIVFILFGNISLKNIIMPCGFTYRRKNFVGSKTNNFFTVSFAARLTPLINLCGVFFWVFFLPFFFSFINKCHNPFNFFWMAMIIFVTTL